MLKFEQAKEPTYFEAQIIQAEFGNATRRDRNVNGMRQQKKIFKGNHILNPMLNSLDIK